MENSYGWRAARERTPLRLPGPDNMGWWVAVAFFIAVLLHVAAFFALGHIKISRGVLPSEEIVTAPVSEEPVEVLPPEQDLIVPEEVVVPPPSTAKLLDELDVIAKLPQDTEMELKPDVAEPEFAVRLENPAMAGDTNGVVVDPAAGIDLATTMPELGRTDNTLPLAADSQIVVDPGASVVDDSNLNRFAEDLLKKGAGGKVESGTLDGVVTLQEMAGLSQDVLVGKKTMLPSDLLFEYNSAELRQGAKVGLMKLALIIDRNPNLYCWIEGYSDLYGGEAYNVSLSHRRAEAVREYLVNSLRMSGERIMPRGYGMARPLVASGTVDEQAPNRRVEIRMRRNPPPAQASARPDTPPAPKPEPESKPVLVKPMRALPVEEETPPPARPVMPNPPKAEPVEEEVLKAQPVEEEPPRAEEIQEE
ncbi:OmpA family protein [Luteolibacter sp. Populi]|uniref:OmpA family protein n=1 Tax=Luteolibacter sp. Populi TaxID=3230487 RepID=UPI00346789BD